MKRRFAQRVRYEAILLQRHENINTVKLIRLFKIHAQSEQTTMNQLEAMQIFIRVAELASFTQAAESLGLPKASVSTAVQQLEGLLGTRLLHRTTRKVQMTQDGQVFYERSKDVLADVEDMQTLFRSEH